MYDIITPEIEKEIDIEIELENIASHCDTNVQKSDTEIEIEKDIEIEKRVRKVWRYRWEIVLYYIQVMKKY